MSYSVSEAVDDCVQTLDSLREIKKLYPDAYLDGVRQRDLWHDQNVVPDRFEAVTYLNGDVYVLGYRRVGKLRVYSPKRVPASLFFDELREWAPETYETILKRFERRT